MYLQPLFQSIANISYLFKAVYAVPMECDSCFNDVKAAVSTLPGFTSITHDPSFDIVSVTGCVAPSAVVRAIQSTGRDAVVRGTGANNSAAVAILENFGKALSCQKENQFSSKYSVQGLARIVSVSPTKSLFDLTLSGVPVGTYHASVRTSGCLIDGPLSTGPEFLELGTLDVQYDKEKSKNGANDRESRNTFGQSYVTRNITVPEMIGRSIVISKTKEPDANSVVGVIARSAGVWQNDKTVCSCTGKTVWEERKDAIKRGVL